jgi:flagellar hook-associated protein 2
MDLGVSGLATGFDWRALIDQISDVERAPQRLLRNEQSVLQQRNNAYGSLKTQLGILLSRVETLKSADLFTSRSATVTDATVATAAAASGAPLGSHTFNITQLASAAAQLGASDIGSPLSASGDVSGLVLSSAPFASAITAGKFTVNGGEITIETTDTLQAVFDEISAATGGAVTASYNSVTDAIELSSASPIVLGSATDTSNFLQASKLYNNGTGTVASTGQLGAIPLSSSLASANFATAVSDGGSGAGEFKINGVSIAFSATDDSLANVITRINDSAAGVTASYDAVNDRLTLANKSTGDMGVALEDATGNFLAATGLSGGTLQRGSNLLYTVNGGGTLVSASNTISDSSSGLTGLTVTALKTGSTVVQVANDTSKVKTAINDFLTEYNRTQSLIDSHTASSTDAKGKVTAGVLAGQPDVVELAALLRSRSYAEVTGLAVSMNHLEDLGIATKGTDNSLTLTDSAKLDAALANNLSGIKDLFAGSTTGLAVQLKTYLDATIGETGTLTTRQSNLTTQSSSIDTQIADQERMVLSRRQQLVDSFVAMETAQARLTQQLQFLNQRFGGTP